MKRTRALLLMLALLLPSATFALPITFLLDHGSTTVALSVGNTVIGSGSGFLSSGFVVFDPASATIPDFSLQSASFSFFAGALPGAYNTFDLSISLDPGAGYSSSGGGSGPFTVTLGPIDVSFSGIASDTTVPITVSPVAVGGVLPVQSLNVTATYNAGQMKLALLGVKLGQFTWGDYQFEIRGDIEFIGLAESTPTPEPGVLGLLGVAGLGGLALARRR